MDNFDLRKFLAESKLTGNSKLINENVDQLKATIKAAIQALDEEDDIPPINFERSLDHYKGQDVNIELNSDRDGSDAIFTYLEDYDDAEEFDEKAMKWNDDLIGYVRDGAFTPLMQPVGESVDSAMEEMVAEYVTEALGCNDMKEVANIIERRCNKAAMELKMETIAEVLNAYEGRLSEIKGSQYFKEMADEAKVGAQEGMIKELHEMAMRVKEEYKEAFMPKEEKVEEKKAPKKEKKDKEEKEEK